MKNKNRVIILTSIIVGVLVVTLGLTYAVLTFNETKGNSELVLGDIWMHYNELDTSINITDMMPSENYTNDYFEFTIDGKNTYDKKDIWYEIVLSHGDYTGDDENRTIRIDDQLLKFKLVEVVDGEEVEIFNNRTYSDLTNKRIHVDTISSIDNNYSKTYRLYMRLTEYTNICMGDADGCDYYINPDSEYANLDWDKLFASIKVNVSGDFEEKSIETPRSCFTYEITSIENPTVNPAMANQEVIENELSRCITYFRDIQGWSLDTGETYEDFCRGTGTRWGNTFQYALDNDWYGSTNYQEMLDLNIIQSNDDSTYTVNPVMATQEYIDPNELTSCVIYFMGDSNFTLNDGEDYTSFCKGNGTLNGNTFQETLTSDTLSDYILINLYKTDVILVSDEEVSIKLTDYKLYEYNENITEEQVLKCVDILTNTWGPEGTYGYDDETYEAFCRDEGTIYYNTIQEYCSYGLWTLDEANYLVENGIIGRNEECSISDLVIPKTIDGYKVTSFGIHEYDYGQYSIFSGKNIKTVILQDNFNSVSFNAFYMYWGIDSYLMYVEMPNTITTIESSAFRNNQLRTIEIPNSVTTVEQFAFANSGLTDVKMPSSMTVIPRYAFFDNQLTHIEIPDSVTKIEEYAFKDNQLETVTIGSGIQYIGRNVFAKSSTSNPNLKSITFTSKTCEEIKKMSYFPWLYSSSPYYLEGYKAKIFGTDGECIY